MLIVEEIPTMHLGLTCLRSSMGGKWDLTEKKQHEAIHKAEMSVKTWLQSGRHLPRLQQDNWTSSALLSWNHVMWLKKLPSCQLLSARVKLKLYSICFGILNSLFTGIQKMVLSEKSISD